jgi:dTDP-3-amino-3,4,6-trideoxy-alpha-D-glucose transaminase
MNVPVPTKSYARQYGALWPSLAPVLERVFHDDEPLGGRAVTAFESAFAMRHGAEYRVVGTNSGTDAAVLVYRSLGLRAGDEVALSTHTFPGVASAIALAGLTPRWISPDPVTGRLTPEGVAEALGPKTRAVLAVHLYGHPEPIDALAEVCTARGVLLIEDCAQAHGARWNARPVGTFGQAAIYSFHPSKNLGAFGDAGCVVSRDTALIERIGTLGNLGRAGKYGFEHLGGVSRLDTLQAALLHLKLEFLDDWNARRAAVAARYLDALAGLPDLLLPSVDSRATPAWHLFVVRVPDRERFRAALAERGVSTGMHYPVSALDQPAHAGRGVGALGCAVSRVWAAQVVSLPLAHELTDLEVERVIDAVRAVRRR